MPPAGLGGVEVTKREQGGRSLGQSEHLGLGTPSLERIMALPGGFQPHAIERAESHPQLTINGTGLRSP